MEIREKHIPITVILLAGGKSKRMGLNKDKGYMKLMGINLIDRVISNITSIDNLSKKDILIVGPKRRFPHFDKVVEDIYPQKGPLGGVFSGLQASETFYNLVIGYDMPFIEGKLIQYMIQNTDQYDVIIPSHSGGLFEPLCAIYSKNCLKIIEKNIKMGKLAVRCIFPFLKIRLIEEKEIKRYDPGLVSFFNINFKSDFTRAEELDWIRSIGSLSDQKGVRINLIRIEEDKKVEISDLVAKEIELTIIVNQKKLITLTCSPGEHKYLGIGFLYTTGVLKKKEDIVSLITEEKSIRVEIKNLLLPISEMADFNPLMEAKLQTQIQNKNIPVIHTGIKINSHTIDSLISKMEEKAVFFKLSGGVHSCGLATPDGSILLFCEDISRYNTIDRIFGEALLKDIRTDDKIIFTSCRITSGIIQRIMTGNVPIVISRSAPTDRAVSLANQRDMTLIGFARGKRMNIYTHFERVII